MMTNREHRAAMLVVILSCSLLGLVSSSALKRNELHKGLLIYNECIHVSRACDVSPQCCSTQCHPEKGTCCLPTGSVCIGDTPMLCCSNACNAEGVCADTEKH